MATLRQQVRAAIAAMDGVLEGESAFKDQAGFWVNGKEIAHFEGSNAIDLRLTRALIGTQRASLRAGARAHLRSSGSDWLTLGFRRAADVPWVVSLAKQAVDAHRAPKGRATAPPPRGADLARRKRFH